MRSWRGIRGREYWEAHASARAALQAWVDNVHQGRWNSPDDLARDYDQDVIHPDQRVVFKIKGNQMIRNLSVGLGISAQALLQE